MVLWSMVTVAADSLTGIFDLTHFGHFRGLVFKLECHSFVPQSAGSFTLTCNLASYLWQSVPGDSLGNHASPGASHPLSLEGGRGWRFSEFQ